MIRPLLEFQRKERQAGRWNFSGKVVIPQMDYQDQNLTCRDCGSAFVWTASEQKFYAEKGFANSPVRCPACRAAKKAQTGGGYGGGGYGAGARQMYDATCSNCGQPCQVPFQPRLDESGKPVKPIYCNNCFKSMRSA